MKLHKSFIIILGMTLVITTGCQGKLSTGSMLNTEADKITSPLEDSIHQVMSKYSDDHRFSGVVFAAQDGKIITNRAYGKANYERDQDHEENMLYQIGSLTKSMTAMMIMQLQKEGKINVTDSLDKFIPSFPHSDIITIHQLLSHSSGLPSQPFEHDFDITAYNSKNLKLVNAEQEIKLLSPPGNSYSYSNIGYTLLGYIVEILTDMSLEEAMQERIFKPLALESTGFYVDDLEEKKVATGYLNKDEVIVEKGWWDLNVGPRGGGGLYSTISDLYKYEQSLYMEKLIDQESLDEIFSLQKTYGFEVGTGYGWFIAKHNDQEIHEHFGFSLGYSSYIFRRPSDNTTIIIFSNFQQTPLQEIVMDIKRTIK